ncbi:MAG TPA: GNAT family N-acetyltransferase [Ilumatobacteraceae bacterium]|nr:GNAT family N-acetyltransferase [Ilumatobacteraceae bacterium]
MDDEVTVRRATPEDADAIVELNARWNGADAGVEVAATLAAPEIGTRAYAVGVDGSRVVSTIGLLSARFDVAGVSVPVGQPEFVATDPAARGRGLVRRQFALVEQWSGGRGDLVQIVAGIRFFYRQLGYQYAVRGAPSRFLPADAPVPPAEGWEVRRATTADLADVRALQADVQRASALQVCFTGEIWPILLDLPHAPVVVAERDGRVGATARVALRNGRVHLVHAAAASAGAARALVHHGRQVHPGAPTVVPARRGSAFSAVLSAASYPMPRRPWLYVRVADPVALLGHLRPVLTRRLAASPHAADTGQVILSLYRSRVGLELAGGSCDAVWGDGGVADDGDDVASVPPDLFAELVFGPRGAAGLEGHPDVDYGPHRDLMHVLFPPLTSDVLVW